MSTVFTQASVSLDGYIAGPGNSGFEHLFDWLSNGDVEVATVDHPELTMHIAEPSASHFRELIDTTGALVVGRRLFDMTEGWGGSHPLGRPVVVLSHTVPDGWQREGERFIFVQDGIEAAVARAREIAGDLAVGVNGGVIARQCLDAGLLDEVWVDLVPVLLGDGTPYFSQLGTAPVLLDGPTHVQQGKRVTHLRYQVRR